ncbi:MAG: hypothetical protein IH628_16760 [Proteobacteria bacterium]|nr:hypothetical protein [Pseudomonadota bacterium]
MGKDILIVVNGSGGGSVHAVEEGFRAAQSSSRSVKVLQILDSDLYHYGHGDLVAPRLNKQRFLLYIRDEVLERGAMEAKRMQEKACDMGVSLEIDPVETDDVVTTVLAEAKKGYEAIFLAREKKKLFPLLQKHLATQLRKECTGKVVEC